MPDFSTLCRRQKSLTVHIPYRSSTGALHLQIDSTGVKAAGLAAARARGKKLGRQPGQRPKSDKVAEKVVNAVAVGRSYRWIARTQKFAVSRRKRKKVEMLFAHLKRNLGFTRLRLRGLRGAEDEFLLAATAQNLKHLAKLVPA